MLIADAVLHYGYGAAFRIRVAAARSHGGATCCHWRPTRQCCRCGRRR